MTDIESNSADKIYKGKQILMGAFLGGPLVAGYMAANNFGVLGMKEKVKPTWIITIVFTVLLFTSVILIPEDWNIPNMIIPLAYSWAIYFIVQHLQSKDIKNFIDNGGNFFDWKRAILASAISLIIIVVVFVIAIIIAVSLEPDETIDLKWKSYGEIQNEISYDPNTISESFLDSLADNLITVGFFDEYAPKNICVLKKDNTYEFTIPIMAEYVNDTFLMMEFSTLKTDLQDLYSDNKVVVNIVVGSYDNIVKQIE